MGIIVSKSKTYVECDEIDCNNRSNGHFNQSTAKHMAEKERWFISQRTGEATSPNCRDKLYNEGK